MYYQLSVICFLLFVVYHFSLSQPISWGTPSLSRGTPSISWGAPSSILRGRGGELRKLGVELSLKLVSSDLGYDQALGRTRARPKAQARKVKAHERAAEVGHLRLGKEGQTQRHPGSVSARKRFVNRSR